MRILARRFIEAAGILYAAMTQALTAGPTPKATLQASPTFFMGLAGAKSARITPFANAANNDTFDVHVWGAVTLKARVDTQGLFKDGDYTIAYLGKMACTVGSKTGTAASGVAILSTEKVCDTITWTPSTTSTTPKGPQSAIETAFNEGAGTAYSPADNTEAFLILPSLGRFDGLVLEFANPSAATVVSANAVVVADDD